ncbi:B3 domain-containing protein [Drosera capensis]
MEKQQTGACCVITGVIGSDRIGLDWVVGRGSMGSRICMNTSCSTTVTKLWKKGWKLKSGQISDLCYDCGSTYENLVYCDTFHSEESGWRECSLCNKQLHCGCSASVSFVDIQDFGGVWCSDCARSAGCRSVESDGVTHDAEPPRTHAAGTVHVNHAKSEPIGDSSEHWSLSQLGRVMKADELRCLPQGDKNGSSGPTKIDVQHPGGCGSLGFQNLSGQPSTATEISKTCDDKQILGIKDMLDLQVHSCLNISLCAPMQSPNCDLVLPSGDDQKEKRKLPFCQPATRPRHILPKPSKNGFVKVSEGTKGSMSHVWCTRPPSDGRLRNQLLPRYWPRITEQELQQISGDLNSTIVPLFEKVLSASDASRIGRLVLPKACAEAYFPPINQSEGVPVKIQDVKGNEWTFQFRFWPNNNSRMLDPGGKLVIGFRKASIAAEEQDPHTSSSAYGNACGGSSISDATNHLPTSSYSHLHELVKGSKDQLMTLPKQPKTPEKFPLWNMSENFRGRVTEDPLQLTALGCDKKTRNIGSKSKRLLMNSEDALVLKITWEETQDLLRPPPSVQPTIVMIEGFEFEEYKEAPVFGRRTFFTSRLPGGQEQWACCDICSKWRKLPFDVLLPPKWICSDNVWDKSRSSCSAPDEIPLKELDDLHGSSSASPDSKKRRNSESSQVSPGYQPSGLEALATAATLGEHGYEHEVEDPSSVGGAATTRHPRHRPGCTCIVCIQPPSGQGKHDPSCVCYVCSTVKRRFKTLMMGKKKRQCERSQAQMPLKQKRSHQDEPHHPTNKNSSEDLVGGSPGISLAEDGAGESSKGGIDLNSHPSREEESQAEVEIEAPPSGGINMSPNLPLEVFSSKRDGLADPACDKEKDEESPDPVPCIVMQDANDRESQQKCAVPVDIDENEKLLMHEDDHDHDHNHIDAHPLLL